MYNNRKRYSSGLVSRAKRNQLAADQQRDSAVVTINQNIEISCGENMVNVHGDLGNLNDFYDTGTAAISIYDILRRNKYFTNYSKLYDQVKIDCVKAKIIGCTSRIFI